MKKEFDLIVLGAGMVGASAALALARNGFSVALIERHSLSLSPRVRDEIDLRVSAISPASQQLLRTLGVWDELSKLRSCDYHRMSVWHENGQAQMNFSCEQIGIGHLGTIVENQLLQSVLMQQLNYLPNVELLGEQEIVAINQQADAVEVKTSNGTRLRASLLVAADGRESTVRALLHLPVTSGSYRQTAIVANVSTEYPHQQTAWQRFLSTGPLAFLPLSNGQSSIVWSVDTDRAEELLQLSDADFMQQLSEAFECRLGRVTDCSARAGFALGWHAASRWLAGRVLLIGDAAHGVHPLAGQGVNLGFGDVALLHRWLLPGQPVYRPRVLRRFERQRKAETVTATHLFSALKLIYAQRSPLLCKIRDCGMSLVDSTSLFKRLVLQSAVQNMGDSEP